MKKLLIAFAMIATSAGLYATAEEEAEFKDRVVAFASAADMSLAPTIHDSSEPHKES